MDACLLFVLDLVFQYSAKRLTGGNIEMTVSGGRKTFTQSIKTLA